MKTVNEQLRINFRCAGNQRKEYSDKIKKLIGDIRVEEFMVTDTVEEMLTLRHPT